MPAFKKYLHTHRQDLCKSEYTRQPDFRRRMHIVMSEIKPSSHRSLQAFGFGVPTARQLSSVMVTTIVPLDPGPTRLWADGLLSHVLYVP
jgi:hypothetical protein